MNKQLCSREKALEIALDKINQGWTLSYISYGFEEWLGVKILQKSWMIYFLAIRKYCRKKYVMPVHGTIYLVQTQRT